MVKTKGLIYSGKKVGVFNYGYTDFEMLARRFDELWKQRKKGIREGRLGKKV